MHDCNTFFDRRPDTVWGESRICQCLVPTTFSVDRPGRCTWAVTPGGRFRQTFTPWSLRCQEVRRGP